MATLNAAGIPIPDDVGQSDIEQNLTEAPPITSRLDGSALAAFGSLIGGDIQDLRVPLDKELTNRLAPGIHLSPAAWRESDYFRPGLSVGADGINENVAKLNASVFDGREEKAALLGNMPAGFLSKASAGTASFIGAVMNPVNYTVGGAASELLGGVGDTLLGKIENIAADSKIGFGKIALGTRGVAKLGIRAGIGAGEGVAFSAPSVLGTADTEHQIGMKVNDIQVLKSLGEGAGLGAFMRGAGIIKEPIFKIANKIALKTAINQLASGKSVDVGEIIKNGYNAARDSDLAPDDPVKNAFNTALDKDTTKTQLATKEIQDKFDAATKDPKIKKQVEAAPLSGPEMIAKYSKIINTDPSIRTDADDDFLDNKLPQTQQMHDIVSTVQEEPWLRPPEQANKLTEFMEDPKIESNNIKEEATNLKTENENLQTQLKAEDLTEPRERVLKEQLLENEVRQKSINQRASELEEHAKLPENLAPLKNVLAHFSLKNDDLARFKKNEDVIGAANSENKFVQTNEDVINRATQIDTPESDSAYLKDYDDALTSESERIPDNVTEDVETPKKAVENLRQKDLLKPEDLELLDKMDQSEDQIDTIGKTLNDYFDCLLGGFSGR